ncbi:hypothetical protein [Nocardioides sp. SYSU D00038]|uniref:hypothetical protein n=1 Tax=Nocardioides sp. SYSU D00038 TaxID=2812554 RepID=UPI0019684899|nr:hypothetical protein [Nocardioides sp. SYSU D00038]
MPALAPDGTAVRPPLELPRRDRLPRTLVERQALALDVPLPWPVSAPAGPPPGDPEPWLVEALRRHAAPEVVLDVDVAVIRRRRTRRVRAWHRLRGDRIATLATAGGEVEVGLVPLRWWRAELARVATVALDGADPPPPRSVELPHELLLAGGHPDPRVRGELLARHGAAVRAPGDPAAGEVVALLHRPVARLQAVVAAGTRIGWTSWLGYGDGWRRLVPVVRDGRATVRVEPIGPGDLGVDVARLVAQVRP